MDISVGIDIIEIKRIRKAVERYGEKFLKRIFTATEIKNSPEKDRDKYYTLGFSFKESVWKTLPEKIQETVYFKDIEILWKNGLPILKMKKFHSTAFVLNFSSRTNLVITTAILF